MKLEGTSGAFTPTSLDSILTFNMFILRAAHDFFKPQPDHVKNKAAVFVLRLILHDWPAETAKQILERLHESAGSQTRILILDQLAPYACPAPEFDKEIKGASGPLPPKPLLANLGEAGGLVYSSDMQVRVPVLCKVPF